MGLESIKVIIFGNGLEIHMNKKLGNFNYNFKQWIKRLVESEEKYKVWNKLTNSGSVIQNSLNEKWGGQKNIALFEALLNFLDNSMRNYSEEEILIEKILSNLGSKVLLKSKRKGSEKIQKEKIYEILKGLVGFFIEKELGNGNSLLIAKNVLPLVNEEHWRKLGSLDAQNYDLICTTNYSDFLKQFLEMWLKRIPSIFPTDYEEFPINIHGKYLEIKTKKNNLLLDRYEKLEINLEEKTYRCFQDLFKNFDDNSFEYHPLILEFYGLSLRTEESFFKNLINSYFFENLIYIKPSCPKNLEIKLIINHLDQSAAKNDLENIQKKITENLENVFDNFHNRPKYLDNGNFMMLKFSKTEIQETQKLRVFWEIYYYEANKSSYCWAKGDLKIDFIFQDVQHHPIYKFMDQLVVEINKNFPRQIINENYRYKGII